MHPRLRQEIRAFYNQIAPKLRDMDIVWGRQYLKSQGADEPDSEDNVIAAMHHAKMGINKWCRSLNHGNCSPLFSAEEIETARLWLTSHGYVNLAEDAE